MIRSLLFVAGLMASSSTALAAASPPASSVPITAADWRVVPADRLLVIDTSKGRVLVEMWPEVAPQTVARITTLTRQGFYNGLKFHRVIDRFMAQTGDPQGAGDNGSSLPDLPGEFCFRRGQVPPATTLFTAPSGETGRPTARCRTPAGPMVMGLVGSLPIQTQPDEQMIYTRDGKVDAAPLFCAGVAGMARTEAEDTANSQFFLMRQTNHNLDNAYTAWGRVVSGLTVVRAIKSGDPESGAVIDPDTMIRVQVASDMPAGERPTARVLLATSARFQAMLNEARARRGSSLGLCDLDIPTEVTGV